MGQTPHVAGMPHGKSTAGTGADRYKPPAALPLVPSPYHPPPARRRIRHLPHAASPTTLAPMAWLWTLLSLVDVLIAIIAIGFVLRGRKEPVSMLAWILGILLLPYAGVILYIFLGADRIQRRAIRKRRHVARVLPRLHQPAGQRTDDAAARVKQDVLPEDLAGIERLSRRLAHTPATYGNHVEIYQEAEATYAALEQGIFDARHHVHLQYYIWQPDDTGRYFRQLLIDKARAGVQVRLLLDAVGCWKLTRGFLRPLREAGVEVGFFMPLYPLRRRWSPNLRNHRKIVIVDGRQAFFGSQNIGDEYRGRRKQVSPWYDTHMRVRGPAALYLQQVFAEDWAFATHQELLDDAYYPEPQKPGASIMQIVPTGPHQRVAVLNQLVFAAVTSASSSIRIVTPYFVPGVSVREALKHAAYRGVQVELVLPTCGEHPVVLWCGRSFYREMLEAGVRIYEFDKGALHSKIMTVDDRWALIGSANMDIRSFRLNFEVTALIFDEPLAQDAAHSISQFRDDARLINPRQLAQRGIRDELTEGAARLFAPLM